jgi:hypothetical protein
MSSFTTDKAAHIITRGKSHNKINVRLVSPALFYITFFTGSNFTCVSSMVKLQDSEGTRSHVTNAWDGMTTVITDNITKQLRT